MSDSVRIEDLGDGISALVLDSGAAPFTFGSERLAAFERALGRLEAKPPLAVFVRATHPTTFCAGADVDEIASLQNREEAATAVRRGQTAFARLEALPSVVVALVHGAAMGGGCELALACDARVGTDATRLGLPETRLGILPAWGGSTRLPRLIGLVPALGIIPAGKTLDAYRARKIGLLDAIVPKERMEAAARRLVAVIRAGGAPRRGGRPLFARILEATPIGRGLVASRAKAAILKETKGFYPAPIVAAETVLAQHGRPAAEGFALEEKAVVDLLFSPVSRELVRVFKLTRDADRPPVYAASSNAAPIREVAVIGAGVMGAGIAQVCVARGFATRLIDRSAEALGRAHAMIDADLRRRVARKELKAHEARIRAARTTVSTAIDGIAAADLVIEAAPERRAVKDSVFREVCAAVREDALIATNTSSFPLADLATSISRPERFLGLHFFNPAPKMPLVEVVRGALTSEEALRRGVRFAKDLGKTPLVVADGPGFLVNRVLAPYLREACALAAAGVPVATIDQALERYGMPMGPFALMDTIGIDVLKDAGDHFAARGLPAAHPVVAKLFEAKRLGRKSGRGFYTWSKDGRRSNPDDALFGATTTATPSGDEIAKRLVGAMAAEARAAVADGLVATADEADLGSIFGTGFPPWRGGLLRATRPNDGGVAS